MPINYFCKYILCALSILLISCNEASPLEKNLRLAGSNRAELEKVLEHYSKNPDDELKFEAAKFLIENMDAHYFFESKELRTYNNNLDSIFSLNAREQPINFVQDSLFAILEKPQLKEMKEIHDLQYITAKALINNIDIAFEDWKLPINKELSFDDFCEYLLPYKSAQECPEEWRQLYKDAIFPHVKNLLDTVCNEKKGLILHLPQNEFPHNNMDYFHIKDSVLKNVVDFSFSAWIYQEERRQYARVCSFGKNAGYYMAFVPYNNNGESRFQFRSGSVEHTLKTTELPEKEWTHITVTYSNKNLFLYVNGAIANYRKLNVDLSKLIDTENYLGKSHHPLDPLYSGKIDDFRFYNRELNYNEVRKLAKKENKPFETREIIERTLRIVNDLYFTSPVDYNVFYGGHSPSLFLHMKKGLCDDYCILSNYVFRSVGIPSTIDYTPQWANRSRGHSWNAVYNGDNRLEDYSFNAFPREPLGGHLMRRKEKVSKIYRQTYSKQKESLAMICEGEIIPEQFHNPCMKDVTDAYIDCAGIKVQLTIPFSPKKRFVYLCNFDNQSWVPVDFGKIKNAEVTFTKVGKSAAYLPMYYHNGNYLPAAAPFILSENGEMHILRVDSTHLQNMILTRKYTADNVKGYGEKLVGGRFQVANNVDFSDSLTVYHVNTAPPVCFNTVQLSLDKPYRFFRFLSGKGTKGGELAELEIFGRNNKSKLSGDILGYSRTIAGFELEKVFDGNILSYYRINHPDLGWVGMDFGNPVMLDSFRFLSRNDDNFIRDGELYELFYWKDKWISLGKKKGTAKQYLEYENVPENALYLLRNLTRGREERIFTYECGKQVWW